MKNLPEQLFGSYLHNPLTLNNLPIHRCVKLRNAIQLTC